MAQHFTFPGFNVTGNADTDRFAVDIGTIKYGEREYVLHAMISHNAPAHGTHSIASIAVGDTVVWRFDRNADAGSFTRLSLVDDEPVIAYVRDGQVAKVAPFSRIGKKAPLDLMATLRYKTGAARYLDLPAALTVVEQSIIAAQARPEPVAPKGVADPAAKAAAREAERQAKIDARNKLRVQIHGREPISVLSTDGRVMHGYPVLKSELPALEPKQFYVFVDSFGVDGNPQNPTLAFMAMAVKGQGMIVNKGGFRVTGFAPSESPLERPEHLRTVAINIADQGLFEVAVYRAKRELETLANIGVMVVEFVAYAAGNNGQYAVFALVPRHGRTQLQACGLLKAFDPSSQAA